MDRRDFTKLAVVGGLGMLVSGPVGCAGKPPGTTLLVRESKAQLAFAEDGRVFEWCSCDHRVQVRNAWGQLTHTLGGLGRRPGEFNGPAALAVAPDGLLYVVDRGNHRVQVFDLDGAFVRSFGEFGAEPGQLSHPSGVVVRASGEVLVSDTLNHRVLVFTSEGTLLDVIGVEGGSAATLQAPRALALGPDSSLHVADVGNGRVQMYNAHGEHLRSYAAVPPGGCARPVSLAVTSEGNSIVADNTAPHLSIFEPSGALIERLPLTVRGLPVAPNHVALDLEGAVHVAARLSG